MANTSLCEISRSVFPYAPSLLFVLYFLSPMPDMRITFGLIGSFVGFGVSAILTKPKREVDEE